MVSFRSDLAGIDWVEAASIILKAPLGRREPEKLGRAFANSFSTVFVFDDDKFIGLGRAICDGEYQAAIYDLALLPEYQQKGIGKALLQSIVSSLPVENIILYAVPGREAFYEKCGFSKMKTAMAKLSQGMSVPSVGYLGT